MEKLSSSGSPDRAVPLFWALAARYREILPEGEFEVEVREDGPQVRALPAAGALAGSTSSGFPFVVALLPLPRTLRLRLLFENDAKALMDFVSSVKERAWPFEDATIVVDVTEQQVAVAYQSATDVLRWRPFRWDELRWQEEGVANPEH